MSASKAQHKKRQIDVWQTEFMQVSREGKTITLQFKVPNQPQAQQCVIEIDAHARPLLDLLPEVLALDPEPPPPDLDLVKQP